MQYSIEVNKWDWMIVGIMVGICIMVVFMHFHEPRTSHVDFMIDCQNDGRRNYECEAMWRGSAVFVPLVINKEGKP